MPAAQGEILDRSERDDSHHYRRRKREVGASIAEYHRVPGDEEEPKHQQKPAVRVASDHRQAVATVK